MRYHFILNGYLKDYSGQMQEQAAFQEKYLADMEEGVTYILCREEQVIQTDSKHHTAQAILLTAARYLPESVLRVLTEEMCAEDLYIFGSDFAGTELAVRAAARTDGSSVTAVHGLVEDRKHTVSVRKMVYGSHMEGSFHMEQGPYCISMAKGMETVPCREGMFLVQKQIACEEGSDYLAESAFYPETAELELGETEVLVAAGRGIRKKENMKLLERVAEAMGGQVGVSRPAAMNAWAPMQRLIGVSGTMAAPKICITAGVSGAAAFYAGIEKSKWIAAINTDERAPIMKMADVAIVDDFLPVITELEELLKKDRKEVIEHEDADLSHE